MIAGAKTGLTKLIRGVNKIKPPEFTIEDLTVFDEKGLTEMVERESFGLNIKNLAIVLQDVGTPTRKNIIGKLPKELAGQLQSELEKPIAKKLVAQTRKMLLKNLFWELTYWKMPELYEALTEGEFIHPGIFSHIKENIKGKIVLDAGAGSGRSTLECFKYGARKVFAVDPSPGLLRILREKMAAQILQKKVEILEGRFEKVPLAENSVDTAIACSAFTAEEGQGGEAGLAELERVTKPGGRIVIIWPRKTDRSWLQEHGFEYVQLGNKQKMVVRFRNFQTALSCVLHFYRTRRRPLQYLLENGSPEIPFEVLGFNPPTDFCWKEVKK